ncbi:stage V sporulation protein AA [Heyndrickxia ginsengihumi]|uniref:stage V sporulation protein AA n=1 Tax=Heyndrickxia ginsengihumi TaxID=363870 RepID=UPI00203BFF18|nr:stage V sporulation protein AA [Heyndrickxia ginsengihumi]MCM3022871.1 stage V sporulation protein AA [Heyndrickxia ginsengihumi]
MDETVYLRLRHRVSLAPNSLVKLSHIAQIIAPEPIIKTVSELPIYKISEQDHNTVVIDLMKIISVLKYHLQTINIEAIGPVETIVEIALEKKKVHPLIFSFIWILLFIGSALAIMNFHEDVSMQEVHQKIYYMLTGQNDYTPLFLQIPYSIGIGLGMIVFFNHIFKKRFNEEPSPLEVEIFNYQQDIDQYISMYENGENVKRFDDH